MTNSADQAYEQYARGLVALGWPRVWVINNEPALRARFARDGQPFPPPPAPQVSRDRYEEL